MVFQWEASGESPEAVARAYWGGLQDSLGGEPPEDDFFANRLFFGVAERVRSIDQLISEHAEHWRLERMPAVDRNILRLGVYEFLAGETAPPVVINEALELGRRFSEEKSAAFLNGVLDAIRRKLEQSSAAGSGTN